MKVWRYRLNEQYRYHHPLLKNIHFKNSCFRISQGQIIINSGYRWDGCSPKWHVFGLFTIGTPDGTLYDGKPWTYHASLVHDVLCQYRYEHGLSKYQVTKIFSDQLAQVQWPLRPLYVWAVNYFGHQDFKSPS
ncbi:MAG: hypothetical protein HRU25_15650 [Psychrobium sp.]|nr:hypothetical protein [Psychrobium sp.]